MTCTASQLNGWICGHSDPLYAGIYPFPASAASVLPCSGGSTSTGGGHLPTAAGDIVDQRAGDREADGTGCRGEGVTVHTDGVTP